MLVNYENYNVASAFYRQSESRGGSLILILKNIKAKERKDIVGLSVEGSIELSCVELEKHIVVCVYRPPRYQNFSCFETVTEDVLKVLSRSGKNIIVCGDFNVNLLENTLYSNRLLSLFKSFNLSNVFLEPTRITPTSATCLDNFFCNCGFTKKQIINCLRSDHTGQFVSFPCKYNLEKIKIRKRCVTVDRMERYRTAIVRKLPVLPACLPSCLPDYSENNSNDLYVELFTMLHNEFKDHFKLKEIEMNPKFRFSDWATSGIRRSRERLFELYDEKSYNHNHNFIDYVRNYSKLFKNVCVTAKANYIKGKIVSAENKIKAVWKVINSETGKIKPRENEFVLRTDRGLISSDGEVAQEFENFFTNIPLKTTELLNSSPADAVALLDANVGTCDAVFEFRQINCETIVKAFNDIKLKNTEDLWGMSVKFCKSIIDMIAPYLAYIFNYCIGEGIFPNLMKHSKVVPLFKSGEKGDPGNFRPVSVLPVLSKVFEKVILNQVLSHFNSNKLLHDQQFGFTKGRSTTDAGAALLQHIYNAWNESHDAIGVFCDLSKAFDCVDHQTLLLKLKHYGIRGRALNLFKSYLEHRIQRVQINGTKSQGSQVKIGVPQGSILGPFLFLVYINDLPFMVRDLSRIVLFADDTSLIFKVNRQTKDIDDVNCALSRIHAWFTANNLVLNSKKTKCIKFQLPNVRENKLDIVLSSEVLEFVDSAVFLGITLDAKLQWGPHITALLGKLSSAAYAVRKIRQFTDVDTARLVYFSYFHSIMSYGILLWGQAANVHSVFVLQKRAIRAIYKLRCHDSLRELFKEINILTVPCQYVFENIMYARRNVSLYPKNSDRHSYNTRNGNKIDQPYFRLSRANNCFMGNCIRFYNRIPEDIQRLSERQFKSKVKDILYSKAYYKVEDYLSDKNCWHKAAPIEHRH